MSDESSKNQVDAEAEAIRHAPRWRRIVWALQHHDQPVRFVIGRALMATGLSPLVRIKQDGFALRFFNSSISLGLWLAPADHVNETERFFRRYLKPGDVAVDVGANIGLYTLVCAVCVGKSGRVYAVEPSPRVFGYLQKNVALNPHRRHIQLFNCALGESDGVVRFSDESQDDRNGIDDSGAQEVPVRRLDALPISEASIALLKVDVEGYEKYVLDGATALLPRVQCIFIETWEAHFTRYGYSCTDVHARLRAQGFRLFRVVDGTLRDVEPGYVSERCEDLIGIRDAADFAARTGYVLSNL